MSFCKDVAPPVILLKKRKTNVISYIDTKAKAKKKKVKRKIIEERLTVENPDITNTERYQKVNSTSTVWFCFVLSIV